MRRCPGGTSNAAITRIQRVLEQGGELKLHTGCMCTHTHSYICTWIAEEVLHLSFHLLFVTSLEAVNWKNGPLVTRGLGIFRNSSLWEWSVSLGAKTALGDSTLQSILTSSQKDIRKENTKKGETKKRTGEAVKPLSNRQTNAAGLFSLL